MHHLIRAAAVCVMLTLASSALSAQQKEYSLFDRFSIGVGGSSLGLSTTIRLDSGEVGIGTSLNFEDDLGLDSSKLVPTIDFRARLGRRHIFDLGWFKADRNATAQALQDIQFGDVTIPIDSEVFLGYDTESITAGYSYFFLLKDRWGLGIRVGLRVVSITAALAAEDLNLEGEGDTSAPLPFIGFSFRYGILPKLRLIADLGWLDITIGDYSGNQFVGSVQLEYLAWQHFAFGGALGVQDLDAEITDGSNFTGTLDSEIALVTLFAKARW